MLSKIKNHKIGIFGIFLLVLSLFVFIFYGCFGIKDNEGLMFFLLSMLLVCAQAFWFIYHSFFDYKTTYNILITVIQVLFLFVFIFLFLFSDVIDEYPNVNSASLVNALLLVVLYVANSKSIWRNK